MKSGAAKLMTRRPRFVQADSSRRFASELPAAICLLLFRLLLTAHAVDAPLVDDHDALAEREEACELRLALDEREVLLAAEVERRLGQLRLRLELGVRPHVVAQVEGLAADLAHGR